MSRLIRAGRARAQIFYGDAFIAMLIFTLVAVLYLMLAGNFTSPDERVLDALSSDADSIASSLVSAGSPANWNQDTVTSIGLTDGSYRLNPAKVAGLMNLSYNLTNNLFGINANYVIFLEDRQGNVLFFGKCVFSNTGLSVQNISEYFCENVTLTNQSRLVASERLVTHNSEIIKLIVYAWA